MSGALRRIDHVVVAVRDLDAAATLYRRLGFYVGARNRHPWGAENRLIQFGTSFIELITVGPDADAILSHEPGRYVVGSFVRDYLRQREGPAMLVLDSDDARADATLFARKGIGSVEPFFFERKGRRPTAAKPTSPSRFPLLLSRTRPMRLSSSASSIFRRTSGARRFSVTKSVQPASSPSA
jgi:hypothetical protein